MSEDSFSFDSNEYEKHKKPYIRVKDKDGHYDTIRVNVHSSFRHAIQDIVRDDPQYRNEGDYYRNAAYWMGKEDVEREAYPEHQRKLTMALAIMELEDKELELREAQHLNDSLEKGLALAKHEGGLAEAVEHGWAMLEAIPHHLTKQCSRYVAILNKYRGLKEDE